MMRYTEKFNKHHFVLITNILMTSHIMDCQSYSIQYNMSP